MKPKFGKNRMNIDIPSLPSRKNSAPPQPKVSPIVEEARTVSEIPKSEDIPATGILVVRSVDEQAEKLIREINELSKEDVSEADAIKSRTAQLYQLVRDFLAQKTKPGEDDRWHNFSVSLARADFYDLSCEVLTAALELYPYNTDLLADYLEYGVKCGQQKRCETIAETLFQIPRVKYTWRGFAFALHYLTYLWEQAETLEKMNQLEQDMRQLADEYQKYFPNQEGGYHAQAELAKLLRKPDEEYAILKSAVETVRKAPQCALRLADIQFEREEYKEALESIRHALQASKTPQPTVNREYLYCLSGLARLAEAELEHTEIDQELIQKVYQDFEMAVPEHNARSAPYWDILKKQVKELQLRYDAEIPSKCERLLSEID